jgi:hypothetical protein
MNDTTIAVVTESVTHDTAHLESLTTMASKIRYLSTIYPKRGTIAKILGIRYQWVRNVQNQIIKK